MGDFKVGSSLWIDKENQGFFGKGRIELLRKIDELGSLAKAAKEMKMSYKAAWDAMKEMEELSPKPLVERTTGGKGGGGSVLTHEAQTYIRIYDTLHEAQQSFFNTIEPHLEDAKALMHLLERSSLRTSARNQIAATIMNISKAGVNSTITLALSDKTHFEANITTTSVQELGLQKGMLVHAIIKASWISLYNLKPSLGSSINLLEGTILSKTIEDKTYEIVIESGAQTFVATGRLPNYVLPGKSEKIWFSFEATDVILGL